MTPDKPTDGRPAGAETLRPHTHTQIGKQILVSPSL